MNKKLKCPSRGTGSRISGSLNKAFLKMLFRSEMHPCPGQWNCLSVNVRYTHRQSKHNIFKNRRKWSMQNCLLKINHCHAASGDCQPNSWIEYGSLISGAFGTEQCSYVSRNVSLGCWLMVIIDMYYQAYCFANYHWNFPSIKFFEICVYLF